MEKILSQQKISNDYPVGRVARKADGKKCGTVIDFVDDFPMYKGWYKKRLSYYKKIDAEVIE